MIHVEHTHKLLYRLQISKEFKYRRVLGRPQTNVIICLVLFLVQDLQIVHRTDEKHTNELQVIHRTDEEHTNEAKSRFMNFNSK